MTSITFNQLELELSPVAFFCGRVMSVEYLAEAMDAAEDFTPEEVRAYVSHWLRVESELAAQWGEAVLPRPLVSASTLRSGLQSRRRLQLLDAAYPDEDDDAGGEL